MAMGRNDTMTGPRQILARLAAMGVSEWVVATGARNLPLVRELMAAGDACLWHGFEERSCGFFALGRIQGGAGPVAVVTTSGTAVAELLPAVIEAFYEGLPLVVVSADRPPEFRGSGAPQAIEQAGLLAGHCGWTADLWEDGRAVSGGGPFAWPESLPWNRPAHLNVCLGEPQAAAPERWRLGDWQPGAGVPTAQGGRGDALEVDDEGDGELEREVGRFLGSDRPTLALVAGLDRDDERRAVSGWLERIGLPAIWERSSGWGRQGWRDRSGGGLVQVAGGPGHERWLQQVEAGQVLRLGAVPSWRWWRDLEDRSGVDVLSLSRSGHRGLGRREGCRGRPVDLARLARWRRRPGVCPVQLPDDPWRDRLGSAWGQFPASEPGLLAALDRAMGDGAVMFVGNSLPIREWNLVAGDEGRGRSCHAARGANGIDGQLSQGLGVGARASESWVVVGDLTALYDLSAPFWLEQLRPPGRARRCRLVVVNNGGGRIFSRLPAFAGLGEAQRRVTENRHSARFADWAAMWGLAHVRVSDPAGLAPDRVRAWPDEVVVELVPDEDQTRAFWDWWQAEAGAAR